MSGLYQNSLRENRFPRSLDNSDTAMYFYGGKFIPDQQWGSRKFQATAWNLTRGPFVPLYLHSPEEVLSGLCKTKTQQKGSLSGIRVSNHSLRLNPLLFADDTMFFTQSNSQSCTALMKILKEYELASEQKINVTKSSILFSTKTPQSVRDRVKPHLAIEKASGVGKYIGLPEHFGRKRRDLYASIVDCMKQMAISWTSRFLSTTGKMTLLQSLLSPNLLKQCHSFNFPRVSADKSNQFELGSGGIIIWIARRRYAGFLRKI